ncbi:hypothetical protein CRUP_031784, partial [Coryphaenoides rupestris]
SRGARTAHQFQQQLQQHRQQQQQQLKPLTAGVVFPHKPPPPPPPLPQPTWIISSWSWSWGSSWVPSSQVKRCLVQVLAKALSKTDSHPLDPDCKYILQAGVKHGPSNGIMEGGALPHEDGAKPQAEAPEIKQEDVKDIEQFLRSVEEKRDTPENERSQESWDPYDVMDKRHKDGLTDEEEDEDEGARDKRISKPTHRYHHKRRLDQRGEETPEDEVDNEYSQGDKRNWRPGRVHQRRHKRDEDHKRRLHKRGGDSAEEEDEQRSESEANGGEKKPDEEDAGGERGRDEALRYLTEKRTPWTYRDYYHSAGVKRDWDNNSSATSHKMEELTKVLSEKMKQMADQSDGDKSTRQQPPMPQEGTENLAAMDAELKKMAAQLHGKSQISRSVRETAPKRTS